MLSITFVVARNASGIVKKEYQRRNDEHKLVCTYDYGYVDVCGNRDCVQQGLAVFRHGDDRHDYHGGWLFLAVLRQLQEN